MPVHQSRTIAEHQQREHSRSGHCASTEGDWKDSELVDIRPNHTHLIFFRFVFKNQSSFLTEIKLFYKKNDKLFMEQGRRGLEATNYHLHCGWSYLHCY